MDVSFLEDPETFEYWYEKMQPARRQKIDAIKPEASKRLSLGAGILLEKALAEIEIPGNGPAEHAALEKELSESATSSYDLEFRGRGKPYIKGRDDVFFNLSHSGSKAALGISDREIGIDIEKIVRFRDALVERVFSEREKQLADHLAKELSAIIKEQPDGKVTPLNAAYAALWTAKESVMKHSGKGIALMPEKIKLKAVEESGSAHPRSDTQTDAPHWSIDSGDDTLTLIATLQPSSQEYDCTDLKIPVYAMDRYMLSVCSEC